MKEVKKDMKEKMDPIIDLIAKQLYNEKQKLKQAQNTPVETARLNLSVKEKHEDLLSKVYMLKQKERSKGIMEQLDNIDEFINNMSVEDIEYVYDKMNIVSTDPALKDSSISLPTLEPLGVCYLVALKNFDFVRDIDDSLLYYTINSLRCIPFE